ncbi:uncharacterized protein LAESUDRAFT_313535 [Laetiporus sulphureus 93-53]|uniref:Uncharacterized protein n=1 Tax=Laetiporus sulphureus 93-53 TaxID=1314785 RepID=A0A165D5T5_9APHY|nr:uncharacterized protein LAESUDRAFT_313535 [Laetiporus sulphureus 93-53]KZT04203.1 hypothetical protein LAESUDRAFT_313535 [Laetiporus sulphureus 93-53]
MCQRGTQKWGLASDSGGKQHDDGELRGRTNFRQGYLGETVFNYVVSCKNACTHGVHSVRLLSFNPEFASGRVERMWHDSHRRVSARQQRAGVAVAYPLAALFLATTMRHSP